MLRETFLLFLIGVLAILIQSDSRSEEDPFQVFQENEVLAVAYMRRSLDDYKRNHFDLFRFLGLKNQPSNQALTYQEARQKILGRVNALFIEWAYNDEGPGLISDWVAEIRSKGQPFKIRPGRRAIIRADALDPKFRADFEDKILKLFEKYHQYIPPERLVDHFLRAIDSVNLIVYKVKGGGTVWRPLNIILRDIIETLEWLNPVITHADLLVRTTLMPPTVFAEEIRKLEDFSDKSDFEVETMYHTYFRERLQPELGYLLLSYYLDHKSLEFGFPFIVDDRFVDYALQAILIRNAVEIGKIRTRDTDTNGYLKAPTGFPVMYEWMKEHYNSPKIQEENELKNSSGIEFNVDWETERSFASNQILLSILLGKRPGTYEMPITLAGFPHVTFFIQRGEDGDFLPESFEDFAQDIRRQLQFVYRRVVRQLIWSYLSNQAEPHLSSLSKMTLEEEKKLFQENQGDFQKTFEVSDLMEVTFEGKSSKEVNDYFLQGVRTKFQLESRKQKKIFMEREKVETYSDLSEQAKAEYLGQMAQARMPLLLAQVNRIIEKFDLKARPVSEFPFEYLSENLLIKIRPIQIQENTLKKQQDSRFGVKESEILLDYFDKTKTGVFFHRISYSEERFQNFLLPERSIDESLTKNLSLSEVFKNDKLRDQFDYLKTLNTIPLRLESYHRVIQSFFDEMNFNLIKDFTVKGYQWGSIQGGPRNWDKELIRSMLFLEANSKDYSQEFTFEQANKSPVSYQYWEPQYFEWFPSERPVVPTPYARGFGTFNQRVFIRDAF